MRLLRLQEVEIGPADLVYRHAPLRALLVWLAFFSLASFMLLHAFSAKWFPGYIFAPILLLFLFLTFGYVAARFHPSNWLVRVTGAGLYIQYRSYLNFELPCSDPSVLFLSFTEIASARLLKERVGKPGSIHSGAAQTQLLRYVELELSGDTAPLAAALSSELAEPVPEKKRWYGSSATLYLDYPVTFDFPPFLRIHWDVSPRSKKFLDALRPFIPIVPTVSLSNDFTGLESLTSDQQKQRLRQLAQRGDIITAGYLARRLYGGSLADAKALVDSLQCSS